MGKLIEKRFRDKWGRLIGAELRLENPNFSKGSTQKALPADYCLPGKIHE